ncbi:MAG: class I SAM-dependent methyltransferase [Nanoarchaeota archaeon]|nr:class I SAM-dependent methyltransferase [Nanoarchaeota archaeon]
MTIFNFIKPRIEYLFLEFIRDKFILNPEKELNKLDIPKGQTVLDYGCGIGSYTIPAAKAVGKEGKVYALDKQSLAIGKVKERAQRKGLHNVDSILSNGDTGLPDKSIDVILLYGVLPEIEVDQRKYLLTELHRVLKADGYLSTRFCFRMKKEKLLEIMEATNLYSLREQKDHILNFEKK